MRDWHDVTRITDQLKSTQLLPGAFGSSLKC